MLSKNKQDEIIVKIRKVLNDADIGIIVMRPKDGSLVLYLNDMQSAIRDAAKLGNDNFIGGN